MSFKNNRSKIGFIGCGNMAQAIARALIKSEEFSPEQIFMSNRTEKKLERVSSDLGVTPVSTNEELIDTVDTVIIAVKPQDFTEALESISTAFREEQVVISLAAGVSIDSISKIISSVKNIVRVIANTPVSLQKGVTGFSVSSSTEEWVEGFVERIFSTMGFVTKVEEGEELQALTVGTSSGIGFIFEMMLYWQEWLEGHGFESEKARDMVVHTFVGASLLALDKNQTSLEELQRKVTSKKGVTAAGLDSLREMELDRILRFSFEKAVMRDTELGKNL